ncbi:MAG: hypothetical protein KDB44_11035 [Mycobacterium sp.]|nr:hypothetical protein [Mycobacterium sp.]
MSQRSREESGQPSDDGDRQKQRRQLGDSEHTYFETSGRVVEVVGFAQSNHRACRICLDHHCS